MANKTVGELPRATTVTTTDLFVLEQANQAKSLTGQVLIQDLATALDGHGGIKNITLNSDYTLTFTLSDDTTVTTTSTQGAKGDKGDPGTDGRAITGVSKTGTNGLVDTYTITFSDSTSTTFEVTNGSDIQSISKTSTSGLVDTYTVTMSDGTTSTFTVTNGNGITSISLTSGTHAPGTSDVYKITFDNGSYTTFSVYNGLNGTGSVISVNDKTPDGDGNVTLTGVDIALSGTDTTTITAKIQSVKEQVDDTASDVSTLSTTVDTLSARIGTVNDGAVTNAKIANNAVTAPKIADNAVSTVYTATLDTTWSGSVAPYTKAQTISGILATDKPIIDVVPSATFADAEAQEEAWANIYRAVTSANTITFYAKEKPTVSIPIQVRCIRK